MPDPIQQSTIPEEYFSRLKVAIDHKEISLLTDSGSVQLREVVKAQCKKQYSSENWEFLVDIHALNNQQSVRSDDLQAIIKNYIQDGAPNQINIPDDMRNNLCNNSALTRKDFGAAVLEVIKLIRDNNLSRTQQDPAFIKAYQQDQAELKVMPQKVTMQLDGLRVLNDLQDFVTQPLKDVTIPKKKSLFGDFHLPFKNPFFVNKVKMAEPFKVCRATAIAMKKELSQLLIESEKMPFAEFKDKYDAIIEKNYHVMNSAMKSASGILFKLPAGSAERNTLSDQIKSLVNVVSEMKQPFTFNPEQIANIKAGDIANSARTISGAEAPIEQQLHQIKPK